MHVETAATTINVLHCLSVDSKHLLEAAFEHIEATWIFKCGRGHCRAHRILMLHERLCCPFILNTLFWKAKKCLAGTSTGSHCKERLDLSAVENGSRRNLARNNPTSYKCREENQPCGCIPHSCIGSEESHCQRTSASS